MFAAVVVVVAVLVDVAGVKNKQLSSVVLTKAASLNTLCRRSKTSEEHEEGRVQEGVRGKVCA